MTDDPIHVADWRDFPMAAWRWSNFVPREMACKGTGSLLIVPGFMDKLQGLRETCGFPLIVTSGYRSPEHNAKVAHTGAAGPHTTGRAVDLHVYGPRARILVAHAVALGFTGIGLSQTGDYAQRFAHLDDLPAIAKRPRPWLWTY